MSLVMFATWLLVGALAGVLAGFVMERRGHGLKTDIFLGLAGSIGGSWIFRGLFYSGGGMLTGVMIAGIGAVIPIIAQRIVWPARAEPTVEFASSRRDRLDPGHETTEATTSPYRATVSE